MNCLFIICVNACNSSDNTFKNKQSNVNVDSLSMPNNAVQKYYGLYFHSKEGSILRICGKDSLRYLVVDTTLNLEKQYQETLPYGYKNQTVYVQLEGTLKGKNAPNTEGVAERFENVLLVKNIVKIEPKDWDNNCFGFDLNGFGNEPFWSLEISKKLNLIDFNDVGSQRYYHFSYTIPEKKGDVAAYKSTSSDGQMTIEIVVKKCNCSDGMSDKTYPFNVEISLNGKKYSGCAQW